MLSETKSGEGDTRMPLDSANVYKQQQILTAPPEKLILMLYNGCLKFMSEAAVAIAENDVQKAHNKLLRAQDIVSELMYALNMDYPIAKELMALYEYVKHQLVQANMKKDAQYITDAKVVITDIREGWIEAMKTARAQGDVPQNQKVAGDSITI